MEEARSPRHRVGDGNTRAFRPEVRAAFQAVGLESIGLGFWTVRGIFAGWLLAMLV